MQYAVFDYGMNGEGVTKVDEVITLVPFALKNEEIELDIVKSFGNYNIAKLTKVIKPSNNRINPPCPYFKVCGGCDLQHMNYSEQLEFKTLLVKKTLKKIANLDVEVSNTVPCENDFNYRNKVSFNFQNNQSGFYKENSKDIVSVGKCLLTSENMNRIHTLFKEYTNQNPTLREIVKNLVVREISNQILVGVVLKKDFELSTFYKQLCEIFNKIGLYKIINNRKDSVVLSGKTIHVGGIKEIEISNFELKYSVDLLSFHQTNLDIQNKLYNKVLSYISSNSTVINGFSGQGLLTAIICSKAKSVVGIEINKSSHFEAEKLKQINNINNMKNVLGDFNKKIKPFLNFANTLILDPSKKGCGKEVMQSLIGIKNIIYISCNPIALAKDLNQIKEHYNIEEVVPFDMFPNTKNVETLVKMSIKK